MSDVLWVLALMGGSVVWLYVLSLWVRWIPVK